MRTYISLLVICTYGCLSQDELPQFTSRELANLLASDSAKSWNLTGRFINGNQVLLGCEKDDLLTFSQAATIQDTAKVNFFTGSVKCPGQSDSIVFKGYWYLLDSHNRSSLNFVVHGDTSSRSIEMISSQLLRLSHADGSDLVVEDFVVPSN